MHWKAQRNNRCSQTQADAIYLRLLHRSTTEAELFPEASRRDRHLTSGYNADPYVWEEVNPCHGAHALTGLPLYTQLTCHPDKSITVSEEGRRQPYRAATPESSKTSHHWKRALGSEPLSHGRPNWEPHLQMTVEIFPCHRAGRACKRALKLTKKFLFQNDILEVMYNCFLSVRCREAPPSAFFSFSIH